MMLKRFIEASHLDKKKSQYLNNIGTFWFFNAYNNMFSQYKS